MLAAYFPENAISWKIHKFTSFYVPCLVDELGTVGLFTNEEGKRLHHLIKLEAAQLSWVTNDSKRLQLIIKQQVLYFFDFRISKNAILRSILQLCKISGPIFLYSKRLTDEFILCIYLILISFISNLIFVTFFYL